MKKANGQIKATKQLPATRQGEFTSGSKEDPGVQAVAARALELVTDGARVGLGSGRAAEVFLDYLGALVRDGLRVFAVPTSQAVAEHAMQASIPLIKLGAGGLLDLTVDGADEVAPSLDLTKGWGGALVRERAGGSIATSAQSCSR